MPAMTKRHVKAPGDEHDAKEGGDIVKALQAMLQGKKAPATQAAQAADQQRRRRVADPGRIDQVPQVFQAGGIHGSVRQEAGQPLAN